MRLNNNCPVNYRNVKFLVISEYYGSINVFGTPKSINLNSPSL